ncbi:MAG: hypothetical protein KA072_04160 [Thermoanaerobaculaceae bacterium]|nr:hypothetical protein [Thermoanaerobaculaceae bacterium]MDI9622624.1 hypothetical protein [Acidobacteriota bacterium]NLH11676.1 hypothetical protein [Holophagae bacterium]HPW54627.1 hypothetical protein [Thermoanaerobaculaceae bacterium]
MSRGRKRPKRPRHSPTELFVAAVGLAILLFVGALVLTSDACRIELDPAIGIQPANQPQPAPVPTP